MASLLCPVQLSTASPNYPLRPHLHPALSTQAHVCCLASPATRFMHYRRFCAVTPAKPCTHLTVFCFFYTYAVTIETLFTNRHVLYRRLGQPSIKSGAQAYHSFSGSQDLSHIVHNVFLVNPIIPCSVHGIA